MVLRLNLVKGFHVAGNDMKKQKKEVHTNIISFMSDTNVCEQNNVHVVTLIKNLFNLVPFFDSYFILIDSKLFLYFNLAHQPG